MAYEKKHGDGVLFVNDRKQEPKDPDYTGSIYLNGKDYALYGRKRKSKEGKGFLSVSVGKEKDGGGSGPRRQQDEFPC